MKREFAAYPLFVKDPFFSIWANDEEINRNNPVFWVGNKKILNGYIMADGRKLVFLGEGDGSFTQRYIRTEGFVTECAFTSDLLDLTVQFVSPLFPEDLTVLSCPVCYLKYDVVMKKEVEQATICFEAEERLCYDTVRDEERREAVTGTVTAFDGFECAVMGLERQLNLSCSRDLTGPDWGYWYISGETCSIEERDGRKYACGVNPLTEHGFFMIGFDDVVSINYFGRPLQGYYFREGKTICDAMQESYDHAEEIFRSCREHMEVYRKEWEPFGEEYVTLCNASLIQSIGAHKLVRDHVTGKTLFLSYECGSCGCIATLDVTYPSAPLFLRYNPELLRGMLYPIFEFAHKDVWVYPFAPHDVGIYPLVYGQYYALKSEGNKYVKGARYDTLPKVYADPVNKDYYDHNRQMPVEESANVLILTYAAYLCDGKEELIRQEFPIMQRWADYLSVHGKHPENQLCTDDFCGRKANNINLTIKAAVALYAFAQMCAAVGVEEAHSRYLKQARELASLVESYGEKFRHLPATFDDTDDTYSLKYNLAFDLFFGAGLFKKETYAREVSCYRENLHRYGVRLYSDINSTKSDWLAFVACFADDPKYREEIFSTITCHMRETAFRVPFGDWYDVEFPDKEESSLFRNRSVQGGIFMPVLIENKNRV